MSKTGYKAMLRDRVPYVVNLALKWCNSKEKWVQHVYDSQIKMYASNSAKDYMTRDILGLNKNSGPFDFHRSIDWENISNENTKHWQHVEGWVTWFSHNYAYMKNTYEISIASGKDVDSIKDELKSSALSSVDPDWQDRLATFLITSFVEYE